MCSSPAAGRDRRRPGPGPLRWLLLPLALAVLPAPALRAQAPTDFDASRRRLEEIRRERERLQAQRQRLEGQVHDVGEELSNLERQRDATGRLVNEIERQIGGLNTEVERVSADLQLAEDNLADRRAVLDRRLVEIYKRGPMATFQALLAAESFGDLLSRYKYLYLTSRQDRMLVGDVDRLRRRVAAQRDNLLGVRTQLDDRRAERESELRQFGALAEERTRRLQDLRRTARTTAQRLSTLERDEARLNEALAALERARRTEAARPGRAAPAPGSITTADLGRLDWPVEGRIVYRFGRDTLPSGGIIRWNGIGIGADAGTPVKAVEAGRVGLVQQLSTYGLTVVIEHGNGYYSVYSHLREAAVRAGGEVARGQVIGTVGGENSDQGPHLHFEIRGENQIALDPADWLRRRR